MKMLLCSIGSVQRRTTLRFGAEIAKALDADVTLLGVVGKKPKVEDLGAILEEFAQELAGGGLPVEMRVEMGNAEAVVLKEMNQSTYDLVVLGALAEKRSRKKLLDSVAMHIVEQATSSVLVVKGQRRIISRVLICASGTEHGHLSVWAGAAVACGAAASATVLHVVDAMPAMYVGLEQMEETLAELLQSDTEAARELKWAAQVVKAECQASHLKLRRGIAADEILLEAQEGDHDLIVLGSSQYAGGLVRALMGDLTREILNRAQRPVLVVRPMNPKIEEF